MSTELRIIKSSQKIVLSTKEWVYTEVNSTEDYVEFVGTPIKINKNLPIYDRLGNINDIVVSINELLLTVKSINIEEDKQIIMKI